MPSKQRLSPRSRKEQAIQLSWAASKLHLLATLAVASEWSPSETRGQNWIQRQFRGETKPTKHRFKPSEQIRRTSWQLRLAKLQVFTCQKLCAFITWYGVRNEIYEILETHVNLFDFTCVTCKEEHRIGLFWELIARRRRDRLCSPNRISEAIKLLFSILEDEWSHDARSVVFHHQQCHL